MDMSKYGDKLYRMALQKKNKDDIVVDERSIMKKKISESDYNKIIESVENHAFNGEIEFVVPYVHTRWAKGFYGEYNEIVIELLRDNGLYAEVHKVKDLMNFFRSLDNNGYPFYGVFVNDENDQSLLNVGFKVFLDRKPDSTHENGWIPRI